MITIHERDRQMDGRTDGQTQTPHSTASRGKYLYGDDVGIG